MLHDPNLTDLERIENLEAHNLHLIKLIKQSSEIHKQLLDRITDLEKGMETITKKVKENTLAANNARHESVTAGMNRGFRGVNN